MRRISGWMTLLCLVGACALYPLHLILDASYGVEGWEMAEVYPESIAEAQADRGAFLEQFGASESEPIAEQLSYVGRPGPFTEQGQQTRFVFVPEDRQIDSPFGTLIIFDRAAGEEFLQSRSLRNISIFATIAAALAALISAAVYYFLRRRSPAP